MEELLTFDSLKAFVMLTLMELVLGVDNIIFISILTDKLPKESRKKAWNLGIGLAVSMRILLLTLVGWVVAMKDPLFSVVGHSVSGRDLILLVGGIFLVIKTLKELYAKVWHKEHQSEVNVVKVSLTSILLQIVLIDMIFSVDSILTAVGLVESVYIMIAAVIASTGIVLLTATHISNFINEHPSVKILALTFLVFIGAYLVMEAFHIELSKTYLYVSMLVNLIVEFLNIQHRRKALQKT